MNAKPPPIAFLRLLLHSLPRLLLVVLALGTAWPAGAHTYWQLPVVVNVLKGDNTTDDTIRARIRGVNDILQQCGNLSITLVKINRDVADPQHPRGGDAEGEVRPDERDTLRTDGQKECAALGAGGKFTIAKGLRNAAGGAMNTVNGVAVIGHPVCILNDGQADNRTWAHEFMHTLGLDHNAIPGNLMEDPRPANAGTALTAAQCQAILAGMIQKGVIVETTIDQELVPRLTATVAYVFDEDPGPVVPPQRDILVVTHAFQGFEGVFTDVTVGVELGGVFPPFQTVPPYLIAYDTDANPLTGGSVGQFFGVEKALLIQVQPGDPTRPPQAQAQLQSLMDGTSFPVEARVVRRYTTYEATESLPDEPLQDVLEVFLSLEMLSPVGPVMLVGASAGVVPAVDVVPPQPVSTLPPARPSILLSNRAASPGQTVTLNGEGWTPGSVAWLSLDHDRLMPFPVSDDGQIAGLFTTPPLPVGDYFLDVVDEEGRMNMKVFQVAYFTLAILRVNPGEVEIRWSKEAVGMNLHATESLSAPAWAPVAAPVVLDGDEFVVREPMAIGPRYYRLIGN